MRLQIVDPARSYGIGLLEFLIALVIFSVGMTGLLSTQLVSKRLAFEALQRSVATAFARELLERVHANAGELDAYMVGVVDTSGPLLDPPKTDCRSAVCTAPQMAMFDLWQWQSWLRGSVEMRDDIPVAVLPQSRACVVQERGEVTVTVSWRGVSDLAGLSDPECGLGLVTALPTTAPGIKLSRRRQVALTTYVARRP